MNENLGVFALWQVLASSVIIGPIMLLIGFFSRQQKRRSTIYIVVGFILTVIGVFCLYKSLSPHNISREAPGQHNSKG